MGSLMIIIMHELINQVADALPTSHPRVLEPVDSHFVSVEPFFDQISLDVANSIVQF